MIDAKIWLSEADKREYYEQLIRDAQEGEIVDGGTKSS